MEIKKKRPGMAHKKYKGMNSTNLFPQPSHTLCRPQILFWGFSKICRHDVNPISMARFCRRYGDGFHHFRCRHDRRLWRYYRRLLTARDVLLGGESDQLVEGLGIRGLDLFLACNVNLSHWWQKANLKIIFLQIKLLYKVDGTTIQFVLFGIRPRK